MISKKTLEKELDITMSLGQFIASELYQESDAIEFEVSDISDLIDQMRNMHGYECVDNGAESCYKARLEEGVWLFLDAINSQITILDNGRWTTYFNDWDEGLDSALERFGLGQLIEYEEVDESYEGEVKIFRHNNEINPICCGDGWERDEHGEVIIFDSYRAAYKKYGSWDNFVPNGHFDPINYTICAS